MKRQSVSGSSRSLGGPSQIIAWTDDREAIARGPPKFEALAVGLSVHGSARPLPTPQVAGLASDFDFALVPPVKSDFLLWIFGSTLVSRGRQRAVEREFAKCQRSHREKGSPRQGTERGWFNLATIFVRYLFCSITCPL
ncbi:hypothetical protein RSOLAG1IB_02500 [Rhizoctonia solani AG-1 IB]|uniref:Uncharacterized protein n=1 Tax=Thanatephorus cucumeris (strain AG1-IB / isolate 7/3/14) TaxID=1108050 RepID=A0A0B7FIF3_THACB|nr:hypothetical protein RSOLAG1IB_02500 [Rhizoctonia solani AG-1 IB]